MVKDIYNNLKQRILAWRKTQEIYEALDAQGFLIFCQCAEVLNTSASIGSPCDGLQTYWCSKCSRTTTFDLRQVVPLRVVSKVP